MADRYPLVIKSGKLEQLQSGDRLLGQTLLTANVTVNLNSSMSAATIQALIDAQPKNLNGFTLCFQFADGTYTMSASLSFFYFHGGVVQIYGNLSEGVALHTNQAVFLDFSSGAFGINLSGNACQQVIRNLKVKVADNAGSIGIRTAIGNYAGVSGCYVYADSKVNSPQGIQSSASAAGYYTVNYVSNVGYGIYVTRAGTLYSLNNASTGTDPNYGLYSNEASTLGKNGTQPTGSTANELTASGGVIR